MEGKNMDKTHRGNKHVCSNCNTKFFDFKKEKIICPRCNTEVTSKKEAPIISDKIKVKEDDKKIDSEIPLEENVDFDDDIEAVISDEVDIGEDDIEHDYIQLQNFLDVSTGETVESA